MSFAESVLQNVSRQKEREMIEQEQMIAGARDEDVVIHHPYGEHN